MGAYCLAVITVLKKEVAEVTRMPLSRAINKVMDVTAMGPHVKENQCPTCETSIEKMSLGGGQTYYCPNRQSL